MERLTDRVRTAELKAIITRMEAGGFEVAKEVAEEWAVDAEPAERRTE